MPSDCSIAGINRLHIDAATITPAAKPAKADGPAPKKAAARGARAKPARKTAARKTTGKQAKDA